MTLPRLQNVIAAIAVASAAMLGGASVASAATTTTVPSTTDGRTFATSVGGWTADAAQVGITCTVVFGITCPTGAGDYQASGGSGGASDGNLRSSFSTGVGVLSNTSVTWHSPTFVAGTVDSATLTAGVRTATGSLLALLGGSATLQMKIADVATPVNSTTVSDTALTNSTGFTTVSAAVPAGAFVSGRTYRIDLTATFSTGIAALLGNATISYDDVSLAMTRLFKPSALSATASTASGVSVSGSVNPQSLSTSVTVQYGTTTAYGATTSPVVVNGSGAQNFSVPIAGLTAGTTYHYRAVAQNSDGTTTGTDGTFVVPLVPANTPPSVTGAMNSTSRTATYDQVAGTTAVRLEVLDGGGAIVGTFNDGDLDGTATITLPSTDGTYGVRIVRDGVGGGTSTSTQVLVSLDRSAPSTSGMNVAVAPALSSDRVRTVTFNMPSDAVSADAQVIDSGGTNVGSAVTATGGNATVTLGTPDGDYRVRVTVRDAAGNAANVVSDAVTLDRTAPSAGGAPVVTGATPSRSRSITFTRDNSTYTATIEVLDANGTVVNSVGVPSGNTGAITLPDADGAYQVQIRQFDAANNVSVTATTPITLDRQPPAAGAAPTVTGANDQVVRNVSFTRAADAATATIEVLNTSGAVVATTVVGSGGSDTATLPSADADYDVRVRVADSAGNEAITPSTRVTLDRTVPGTYTDAPVVSGATSSLNRSVVFTRNPAATSVAIDVKQGATVVRHVVVASGGSGTIILPAIDGSYDVTVTQDGVGSAIRTITLDTTAPNAGPAPTVTGNDDSRTRTVTFTRAGDAAQVAVELLDANGNVVSTVVVSSGSSTPVTLPNTDGTYRVRVRQTDAAGNSAVSSNTTVALDRTAPDGGSAPTVTGDDNDRTRSVTFERAADATTVTIQVLAADNTTVLSSVTVGSGDQGTITLPNADGAYRVRVRQADAAGNFALSPSTPVALDRTAPSAGVAPTVTGAGNVRTRHVTFTRANDAATVTIEVVSGATVVATFDVPSGAATDIVLPDTDGGYGVRVRQADAAGNADTTPATPVVLDRSGPTAGPAPQVTGAARVLARHVAFTRAGDAVTVVVEVLDAGGGVVGTVNVASGGDADLTLPDTDGAYRVRVRQTDADGNDSLTPATTVSLDRSAPNAGGAPAVTGADDALTRHVVFTRASDASTVAIEILDANGTVVRTVTVASGNEGDVTLPNEDGTYRIRVRQTDAGGNDAYTASSTVSLVRETGGAGTGDDNGGQGGGGGGGTGGGTGTSTGTGTGTGVGTATDSSTPTASDPGGLGALLADCYGGTSGLVVTDVHAAGATVVVAGLSLYAPGTKITIVDSKQRTVATTTATATGSFTATAPLPVKAERKGIRYTAVISAAIQSKPLKLVRATTLDAVTVAGNTATLTGRINLSTVKGTPKLKLAVRGGRGATACKAGGGTLKITGKAKLNRKTGKYTVKVTLGAGTGKVAVKVRVTGSLKSASLFVVR